MVGRSSSDGSRGSVLIAALSARALAQAAGRAGYAPLAADLFRDEDLCAVAAACVRVRGDLRSGFVPHALHEGLLKLACEGDSAPLGLVYGAGFEAEPGLLEDLARIAPLLGNLPDIVRRVKAPLELARVCVEAGIPHPETSAVPPRVAEGWLVKRAGSAGGMATAPWRDAARPPASGCYWQRRVSGVPISVAFLANGRDAAIVGFSEQWTAPCGSAPFRFGGASSFEPPDALRKQLSAGVVALAQAFGLLGLNGADFMVDEERFWLLEVNPRPGATLDLFDSDALPLFGTHLDACHGRLPAAPIIRTRSRAMAVVYAGAPFEVPPGWEWPDWSADMPAAGAAIPADAPVCTVFAEAGTAHAARRAVADRSRDILRSLLEHRPARPSGDLHAAF